MFAGEDELATAALHAVRAVARSLTLPTDDPVVLAGGANLVVHLAPAPVVAKAAASTRTIRDPASWLARELEVAGALRAAGAPSVAPADGLPARVHVHDGVPVTLWEHVPPGPGGYPEPARFGAMLADLHAALRASALDLPRLAPAGDIPRFLERAERRGTPGAEERARMQAAYERVAAAIATPNAEQALHGDAHPGNLLSTPDGGWLWCDFEDTCSGPLEWDLAALRRTPRLDGVAALHEYARASGRDVDDAALAPWIELRELHLDVWLSLYAEREPPPS